MSPTIVLVDTTALIDQCLSDISPTNGPQPCKLALDLEGVNLCRHGSVSIVQIFADTSNVIWLVDITALGREAFDHKNAHDQSLREVFQNPLQQKLLFDVRSDADALFNIYEIELANVFDLQLADVANRRSRYIPTKFVSGLSRCIELYVGPPNEWKKIKEAGNRLFSPEKGGSYSIFEQRPLDPRILEYCAQDVALMFQLEAAVKRTIQGKGWEERILLASTNRVAESKSSNYDGPQGRHRAIAPVF